MAKCLKEMFYSFTEGGLTLRKQKLRFKIAERYYKLRHIYPAHVNHVM